MPNFTEGLPKLDYLDETAVPRVAVNTPFGELKFQMYGQYTEFRIRTLLTKEPETVTWISEMNPGEELWDIGANTGIYSLLAGIRGVSVCAFEPSPTNFWLLNQNAALNENVRIRCLPLAIADSTGLVPFDVDLTPAAAGVNQIGKSSLLTVIPSYSLDDLCKSNLMKSPQHLKIDVDGIELEILRGSRSLLQSRGVQSVMCEVDESDVSTTSSIHALLTSAGFGSVTTRFPPYFEDNYYLPRANHLFPRTARYVP
jgi:FkbM family methyltransferase